LGCGPEGKQLGVGTGILVLLSKIVGFGQHLAISHHEGADGDFSLFRSPLSKLKGAVHLGAMGVDRGHLGSRQRAVTGACIPIPVYLPTQPEGVNGDQCPEAAQRIK